MPINILYDFQIFSEQRYGGISRYIYEIAKRIAKSREFDVEILSPLYINNYLKDADDGLVRGKYIPAIPNTGKIIKYLNKIVSRSIVNKNTPDLIHQTYYWGDEDLSAVNNTKYVLTVHDMINEKLSGYFQDSASVTKCKLNAVKRADHIICVSESTKTDLLDMVDIDHNKISVIHHGCTKNSQDSEQTKPIITSPYVLFVGQRAIYKNFKRLLTAFSNYNIEKDFTLVCFGGGEFLNSELEMIRKLGLKEHNAIQIGGQDSVLMNLYANASAFICPSIYEGFGMPLLEAMASQCPVICSNTSSFPEVAGVAAEYFDPYDTESIGTAMERVLYSQEVSQNLIELGYKNVALFSWEQCTEKTMSAYLEMV